MKNQLRHERARLSGAIVLGAVVIAAGIFASSYFGTARSQTVTRTVTIQTTTSTGLASSYVPNVVFKATKWPASFTVGQYSFSAAACGPPCGPSAANGTTTMNLGSEVNFNVTYQGQTQRMGFGWPPMPPNNYPNALPSPSSGSLYGGGVTIKWFTNGTGLYISIVTKS